MTDHSLTLPDEAARELYRAILREGGRIRVSDIRPEDEPTVKQLADLGLLFLHIADGVYTAVNPRAVGERIGAEPREKGARLIGRPSPAAARRRRFRSRSVACSRKVSHSERSPPGWA
ncbi:hypothetical protein ACH4E7_04080 [Kitasatospora sp. NPDC018058]|uniref:hypothetical protein n=1 Tax=Kitasatospora sp. NPDC018058 TaxID=3364025 RepID=UPI0037BFE2A8